MQIHAKVVILNVFKTSTKENSNEILKLIILQISDKYTFILYLE